MGADIKGKIDFLEIVSEGEKSIIRYFNELGNAEERTRFYNLVSWGASTDCVTGLSILDEGLFYDEPRLTTLGKTVYEGRKDLIFK